MLNLVLDIGLLFSTLSILTIKDVYAYIDPGSGSYFLQIMAAGTLSGLFLVKKFWRKIVRVIFRREKITNGKNKQ